MENKQKNKQEQKSISSEKNETKKSETKKPEIKKVVGSFTKKPDETKEEKPKVETKSETKPETTQKLVVEKKEEITEIDKLKAKRKKIKSTIEGLRVELEKFVNDKVQQIMTLKVEAKELKKQIKQSTKPTKKSKTAE